MGRGVSSAGVLFSRSSFAVLLFGAGVSFSIRERVCSRNEGKGIGASWT